MKTNQPTNQPTNQEEQQQQLQQQKEFIDSHSQITGIFIIRIKSFEEAVLFLDVGHVQVKSSIVFHLQHLPDAPFFE